MWVKTLYRAADTSCQLPCRKLNDLGDPQPFFPEGAALGERAQLGMAPGEPGTGTHGGQEDQTGALVAPSASSGRVSVAAAAAPTSPTDETKVPHYFGPFPNWANSPLAQPAATVTITVTNTGPNAASGVVVNDPVPQGTTFFSASPAPASAPPVGAAGTVVWNVGNLNSGASATLTLRVKVSAKGNTLIVNTATVTSSSSDPNLANNTATITSKRKAK
jgi:uncharacterized repeat protein (TIGR01451 family)